MHSTTSAIHHPIHHPLPQLSIIFQQGQFLIRCQHQANSKAITTGHNRHQHQLFTIIFTNSITGTSSISPILSHSPMLSSSRKLSCFKQPRLKNFLLSFKSSYFTRASHSQLLYLTLKIIVVVYKSLKLWPITSFFLKILKPRGLSTIRAIPLPRFLFRLSYGMTPKKGRRLRVSQTMRQSCPPSKTRSQPQSCRSTLQLSLNSSRVILLALSSRHRKQPSSLKSANSSPSVGSIYRIRSVEGEASKQVTTRWRCPIKTSQTERYASSCSLNYSKFISATFIRIARVGAHSWPLLTPMMLLHVPPSLMIKHQASCPKKVEASGKPTG